jgi:hypothetical protein
MYIFLSAMWCNKNFVLETYMTIAKYLNHEISYSILYV